MAKKQQQSDPKAQTLARIKRTEAYAERVRALFAATVNEILALNKTMPTLNEGEMFSFDNESLKKQREVERLLRQLHSVATMAIEKGIRLEWATANAECDKLVLSCFGKNALNTPEFTAWTQRNEAAQAAFISRSERGLNLSQRVWKTCRQLRDEMEVAITVAVGDGTSAASMSRSVRKYLNDPDLMFRRFRYKVGEEIEYDEDGIEIGKKIVWGKKWKKRIKKPDGTVGWIDYDKDSYSDEWTGPGYYKSSAQNAMRVARTETNIAYRRADNERWRQMDFVLGQRVQLSRNHPKKDICDKLAGDYPPDFVFDGWHPQCFCFVTPILMDEYEIFMMNEAMLRGETYTPRGKRITQYPENFKQWVRDNEERIVAAHDVGTDPYFVRNNFGAVQDILNPKKQLTPQEIAQQRHEARTPEQEEKIRLAWQERKERIETEKRAAEAERIRKERINNAATNVLNVANNRFADFGIDTVALDAAIQSGDTTLINAETRALAKMLSEKQKQIKTTASNVMGVASKYKDFAGDADMTSLSDVMKTANVSAINAQTRALAQRVVAIKKQLQTMSSVIPNAQQWSDQFTVAELQAAHDAVQKKLASLSSLPMYDQIKAIEKELKYVVDPTYLKPHTLYPTWKVSQSAYAKALDEVNHQIAVAEANAAINVLKTFIAAHPKATTVIKAVTEAETMLSNGTDINLVKSKIAYAEQRKMQLEAAAKKRAAKNSKISEVTFAEIPESKRKKLLANYQKNTVQEVDDIMRPTSEEAWEGLLDEEKYLMTKYTQTYSYLNEPLRNQYYCGTRAKDEFNNDMPKLTAGLSRVRTKQDMIVRRGTSDYPIPELGVDASGNTRRLSNVKVGDVFVDGAFLSTACHRERGFFMEYNLVIYVPKGAQGIFAEPFTHYNCGSYDFNTNRIWNGTDKVGMGHEFEWIGQRGSKFKVIAKHGKEIHLLLIGQQFTQPTAPPTP